jgi:hypothetical protein
MPINGSNSLLSVKMPVKITSVIISGLLILTLIVAWSSAEAASMSFAPSEIGAAATTSSFSPAADSYVESSNAGTNYGSATQFRVDNSPIVHSYLRFDIQGLSGTVTNATLRIYANSSSTAGITVYSVSDSNWDELTINYSNAPPIGASIGSSGSFSGGAWTSVDVTALVTGNGTISLALAGISDTAVSLASRESGANVPQLVITLGASVPPTVSPSATPTQALVATATSLPVNTVTPTAAPFPTQTPVPGASAIQHVFVVVMENHSYKEVWNTGSSPYITSLGNAFARATNYRATSHPSLPNYLDLYGGSNYGITTDCSPSASCLVNATNLADNLEAKGLTWKGYMESMPSNCYLKTSGKYAPKHNPMVYFDDIYTNSARCNAHDVPYTALSADLASASTTPNYSLIVPNLCNDMHDCSITTGDNWLKANLPAILNSPACTVDKCLLILTWDEDDGSQSNQVLTIFAGSGAKTGGVTSSVAYTHFSMLRTIENIFGLPTQTTKDAAASPMTDLLR